MVQWWPEIPIIDGKRKWWFSMGLEYVNQFYYWTYQLYNYYSYPICSMYGIFTNIYHKNCHIPAPWSICLPCWKYQLHLIKHFLNGVRRNRWAFQLHDTSRIGGGRQGHVHRRGKRDRGVREEGRGGRAGVTLMAMAPLLFKPHQLGYNMI